MKSKLVIIIPVVLVVVAVVLIVVGVFGDDDPAAVPGSFTDEAYPFSFEYPPEWGVSENPSFEFGSRNATSSVAVQFAPPENQIVVSEYKLSRTLAPGENAPEEEIQGVVDNLEDQTDGRASRLKVVRYAGAPGYEYSLRFRDESGQLLVSRIVYLFTGQSQIEVNCQSNSDGRDQVEAGCTELLNSLTVSNPA